MTITLDDLAREACCPDGCAKEFEPGQVCRIDGAGVSATPRQSAVAILRRLLTEPPSRAMLAAAADDIDDPEGLASKFVDEQNSRLWTAMAAERLKELLP